MSIEVAGSSCRIECGTRFIVGEIIERELRRVIFVQNASIGIAGKGRRQTCYRFPSASPNTSGACVVGAIQFCKPSLQTGGIELTDWKWADAALGASGTANKPLPRALNSLRKRGVDNPDKATITRRKLRLGSTGHDIQWSHKHQPKEKRTGRRAGP